MARRRKSKEELEELTRTQVLNLKELEKAANFEKKTSQKPAAIFAILGAISISLGIFYPNITTMLSGREVEDTPSVSEQRQEDTSSDASATTTEVSANSLSCSMVQVNPEDATLVTTTYNFQFQELGTLVSYQKESDITVSAPVAQTPSSIVTLDTSITNLMQTPIVGYTLEKVPTASTDPTIVDGYTAKLSVDFTTFNPATLTPLHTSNTFANVEFVNTDTKDIIQQRLMALGYTCQ